MVAHLRALTNNLNFDMPAHGVMFAHVFKEAPLKTHSRRALANTKPSSPRGQLNSVVCAAQYIT